MRNEAMRNSAAVLAFDPKAFLTRIEDGKTIRQYRNKQVVIPEVSQQTLAAMVGTTRSRVSHFMNRFRKMGFIHYNGGLQVHSALLTVVLRD